MESALKWSNRSIELAVAAWEQTLKKMKGAQNSPPLYDANMLDTNARLLYKLGRKPEAIERQGKAVQAQKLTGMPAASFENTLAKMIDETL